MTDADIVQLVRHAGSDGEDADAETDEPMARITNAEAAAAIDTLTRFFEQSELATPTMCSHCRQLSAEWN